jgi:hypothetical protein
MILVMTIALPILAAMTSKYLPTPHLKLAVFGHLGKSTIIKTRKRTKRGEEPCEESGSSAEE